MDVLMLCYRGEPLREFSLRDRALEVGRGAGCDIVVHEPGLRDRALLVRRGTSTVIVRDLERRSERELEPNAPLPLGKNHSLVCVPGVPTSERALPTGRTEPLAARIAHQRAEAEPGELSLIVGAGPEARRISLDERPVHVGTAADCDLVLLDRSVSRHHARFERSRGELRVRDLGSRNGTFVGGVEVSLATLGPGSIVRVGRTDLRVVPVGRPADARELGMIAVADASRELVAKIERYAPAPLTVLVTGETGVGKELVARALHERGPRRNKPFVAVNAGGMPPTLIESELFGHEKGAFTGAARTRRGFFEQAHEGTLFFDEIGELPLELQARLLRVLETRQIRRVGGECEIPIDVRIVCATHRSLERMVADGTFREDLYFRINQLALRVEPLRRRREDVVPLAEHFLAELGAGRKRLASCALERLEAYDWAGNVRELKNAVGRAVFHSSTPWITREAIDAAVGRPRAARVERDLGVLEATLRRHDGNVAAAARALNMPRSTLRDRLSHLYPRKSR